MDFITELLNSEHDRSEFSCGKSLLDTYLIKQANQDKKRQLAVCYILAHENSQSVAGYYTLSNSSILADDIPDEVKKKFPRSCKSLPTTLIGRLALDDDAQGSGLGKLLLIDALCRCLSVSEKIGSVAVVVDPIDDEAEAFYSKYGFILLPDSGKMFLPMKTVKAAFKR